MRDFSHIKDWPLFARLTQALCLAAMFVVLAPSAFAQTSFTRSNTTGTSAIPDNQCLTGFGSKTISVTDTGIITDLDVGVVADHTWRSDLQVQLISPAGTNRTLVNGVGANADNLNVRLNDGATTIAGGIHPALTSYANTSFVRGPSNPLSAFNGESVTGNWTLRICDSAGADTGSLREAHLHFTASPPPPSADLSLSISPTSATRSPGQQTTFTLIVANDGPDDVSGVTVDAFLPAGLAHVSNNGGGSYNVASGLWTIAGTITAGTVKTLDIVTSASASGSGVFQTEILSSSLTDPDSTPNNAATLPNEDDTATANITLVAPPAAPPAPLSCRAPGMLDWANETWTAGALTGSYLVDGTDFDVTFSGDTGFFVNNAAFGGQTPLISTLLTGGQPSASSLLYVVNYDTSARQLDLIIDAGIPGEGVDSIQFGMFDVDENPDTTANVNFIDRMTVTGTLGGIPVAGTLGGSASNTVSGNQVTGIAAADSTASDGNFWVTFNSPVDRIIVEYDNDPAVNAAPGQQGVGLHILGFCPLTPDLSIAKTVDNPTPVTGTDVTYTLTVTNDGSLDAADVVVTDVLPAGLSFVSASPSADFNDTTGIWTVGSVAQGTPEVLTITATATGADGAVISNNAEITSASTDDLDSTYNDGQGDDFDTADITIAAAAPELTSEKTVEVYDPSGAGLYAIPGNDVIYTISVTNSGNIAIDNNSIFLVDNFPSDIAFYNGDIDGAGPQTDPVYMDTTGSPGLTFTYDLSAPNPDIGYSAGTTAPTTMAACGDTPGAGYDDTIRFICFAPKGSFAATDPDSTIEFKFRARIPNN